MAARGMGHTPAPHVPAKAGAVLAASRAAGAVPEPRQTPCPESPEPGVPAAPRPGDAESISGCSGRAAPSGKHGPRGTHPAFLSLLSPLIAQHSTPRGGVCCGEIRTKAVTALQTRLAPRGGGTERLPGRPPAPCGAGVREDRGLRPAVPAPELKKPPPRREGRSRSPGTRSPGPAERLPGGCRRHRAVAHGCCRAGAAAPASGALCRIRF